jgi:hypothetical protein
VPLIPPLPASASSAVDDPSAALPAERAGPRSGSPSSRISAAPPGEASGLPTAAANAPTRVRLAVLATDHQAGMRRHEADDTASALLKLAEEVRDLKALLLRPRAGSPRASPDGSIDAAIRAVLRDEVRAEARAALADHRAREQEREGTRLVPLAVAAKALGLTPKALRSRIERGSVEGAARIGGRWHVPLGTVRTAEIL